MPDKPAIDGGTPVRATLLPYGRQSIDEADIQAVAEVLRSDWLTTGPTVRAFEEAFAERVGARCAIAVNSGTAALHAAVFAAGIGVGDEVITTPMSFAATANAVLYCGGRPIFADIEPDTGLIDADSVAQRITPNTKAVITVDYTGQPADYHALTQFGLPIIDDAAHALGATYQGKPVGALTELTTFSTHPVKHITTGEGGIIATDNLDLTERMRRFRNHGINAEHRARADWAYRIEFLGYNYRISDIACALGLSQLAKLQRRLDRRADIAAQYDAGLNEIPCVRPIARRPDRRSAHHLYVVLVDFQQVCCDKQHLFRAMRAEGIGVNVHYIPIYRHPFYQNLGYAAGLCPNAEAFYAAALTLPLWPGMTDKDVQDVLRALNKVMTAYCRA